jgi:hypothetical protein
LGFPDPEVLLRLDGRKIPFRSINDAQRWLTKRLRGGSGAAKQAIRQLEQVPYRRLVH